MLETEVSDCALSGFHLNCRPFQAGKCYHGEVTEFVSITTERERERGSDRERQRERDREKERERRVIANMVRVIIIRLALALMHLTVLVT
jgi:hypothetical protein